jgi:cyclic pyranopterin phosphate synthase
MLDFYRRPITYLRISVTEQCNLRCIYCADGTESTAAAPLEAGQIMAVVKSAARLGIDKIRLTGGEPLLRPDLPQLIGEIKSIKTIKKLGLTTNGSLLYGQARGLYVAGLRSLNVSLDTLDAERYCRLTGGGSIEAVTEGLELCRTLGFSIKINMVMLDEQSRRELDAMNNFCRRRGFILQTIASYNLTEEKNEGHGYARPPRCEECNRLRLLADGRLMSCLYGNCTPRIDFNNIEAALRQAVMTKPLRAVKKSSHNVRVIGG